MSLLGPGSVEQIGVDVVAKTGNFFRQVDDAVDKAQGKMNKLGGFIGKALVAGAAVGGAAIAGLGIAAVKMGLDFEAVMSNIETQTNIPKESIKGLTAEIMALSKELGIAPTELAASAYFVLSAGFEEAADAANVLRAAAELSTIGLGSTDVVARALTQTLVAYGEGSDQANKYADIFLGTVKAGAAEADELAGSLSNVVPFAAQLGVKFPVVAGALAQMTNKGFSLSEAATALNQLFTQLISPSEDLTDALGAMGYTTDGLIKGLQTDALGTLTAIAKGAEESGQTVTLFADNVRASRAFVGAFGADSAETAKLVAQLSDAEALAAARAESLAAKQEKASFKLKKTMNRLRVSLTQVGLRALPLVAAGLDLVNGFFDAAGPKVNSFVKYLAVALEEGDTLNDFLADFPPEARPFIRLIGEAAVTLRDMGVAAGRFLGPALFALGRGILRFGSALQANETAMKVAKDLLAGLLATWLAIVAVKKVVTFTQNVVHTGQQFIQGVKDVVQVITQNIKRTGELLYDVVKIAQFWTQVITQQVVRTGSALIEKGEDFVQTITQNVVGPKGDKAGKDYGKSFGKKLLAELPRILGGFAGVLLTGLVATGGAAGLALTVALTAAVLLGAATAAAAFVGAFLIGIKGLGLSVLESLASGLTGGFIATILLGPVGLLAGVVAGQFVYKFREAVAKGAGIVAGALSALFVFGIPALVVGMFRLREKVREFFQVTLPNLVIEGGPRLLQSVGEMALTLELQWLEFLGRLASAFFAFLTVSLPAESGKGFPIFRNAFLTGLAAVFIDLPKWWYGSVIPATFNFLTSTLPTLIVQFLTSTVPSAAAAAYKIGNGIVEGLINGVGDLASKLKGPFEEGFNKAFNAVKGLLGIHSPSTVWAQIGKWIVEGIIQGVKDAIPGLSTVLGAIKGLVPNLGGAAAGFTKSILGREHGGPVRAGQLYQVNERGIEYFRPQTSGEIIPLTQMAPAAGGGGITNYGRWIVVNGPGRRTADVLRDMDRMVR